MNEELSSLLTRARDSRREILGKVAAGFALAAQPISAETITTSDEGLVAGDIRIPAEGGEIPGYRAMPAAGSNFPVVLVVQEIFGLHEHIRDLCRRLAKEGYFAISAELYARQGDVSKLANIQEIFGIVRQVPDAQVMRDLDAQVAFAKASGKADAKRVAVTGFCWGGRIVWLYAAHNSNLKAGAAWYGRLVGEANALQPKHPVDVAAQLNAPVLGLYGADDTGIPLDTVEKMREAVKQAGKTAEIIVYPNTPHAFNADYRPSYREKEAKEAWAKMLAWFRKNGV